MDGDESMSEGSDKSPTNLKDLLGKRPESKQSSMNDSEDNSVDQSDLDFVYDDADTLTAELGEFYSYTEEFEFALNRECFESSFGCSADKQWTQITEKERRRFILKIMDQLEVASPEVRLSIVRVFAYICQGNFAEISSEPDLLRWVRYNCFLLYDMGVYAAFFDVLKLRIDMAKSRSVQTGPNNAPTRKASIPNVCFLDSTEMRNILAVLYTITEVLRSPSSDDSETHRNLQVQFISELSQPVINDELPALVLFQPVLTVCSDKSSTIPTKKILLLLWKVILASLGGLQYVQEQRNAKREEYGLKPLPEDAIQTMKTMRASTPPIDQQSMMGGMNMQSSKRQRGSATSGSSTSNGGSNRKADTDVGCTFENNKSGDLDFESLDGGSEEEGLSSEDGDSPDEDVLIALPPHEEKPREIRALPWSPKIRTKDIQEFLDHSRNKYVGFKIGPDITTLAGLPQPIHESVAVLKQHLYVPLSEVQMKDEEELLRNPMSRGVNEVVAQTPTEILYKAIYPNLPQYMIALLKILLAATPTSMQGKSDTVNILSDIMPPQMPSQVFEAMKLQLDVNRHKEIIVKAVSGLLLLLLKHFKLNHVCQFEHCAQHMVFANCIPLVLKFFNQNIVTYVQSQHTISLLEFPRNVIGEKQEVSEDSLKPTGADAASSTDFCWRNMFSCINLLRILNKLVKWKNSRIMMLVVFKSGPILKRTLKLRQAMLQLYVLKLLKLQTKFLGRQWRKSNMKTMSAIYQKVRHRMQDDWAFGNELDTKPWDFQVEESMLRSRVEKFNSRRYENDLWGGSHGHGGGGTNHSTSSNPAVFDDILVPVDNNLQSVLNQPVDLPRVFTDNYEKWVEREVFTRQIDWDALLAS